MIDRNEDPSIGSQHAKLSAGDSQFICEPLETLLFSPDSNTDNREPKLTMFGLRLRIRLRQVQIP